MIENCENKNNLHILLIEDNLIAQKVGLMQLRTVSAHVDLAENAEKALSFISAQQYDIIFLDIGLPDGDGKDVARFIRHGSDGVNYYTPIVAITAHGLQEEEQCLQAGINQVYAKPLTLELLVQIIQDFNLLEQRT